MLKQKTNVIFKTNTTNCCDTTNVKQHVIACVQSVFLWRRQMR